MEKSTQGRPIIGNAYVLLLAVLQCTALPAFSQSVQEFQISPPRVTSNGSFTFSVSAPLGRTYVLDATTNLLSWLPLVTNIASPNQPPFTDANAFQFQQRIYRGRLYWSIIVQNRYSTWETNTGADGRTIAFPSGWATAQGNDGRMIAFPPAWDSAQGADGRMIAFPSGWTTLQGSDGRLVAYPLDGYSTAEGSDGRAVWIGSSGWTNSQGADGRQIGYLPDGWTTLLGCDGRLTAYPSNNFSTTQDSGGLVIAYPSRTWAQAEGAASVGSHLELEPVIYLLA
jgi:hypothetical protein